MKVSTAAVLSGVQWRSLWGKLTALYISALRQLQTAIKFLSWQRYAAVQKGLIMGRMQEFLRMPVAAQKLYCFLLTLKETTYLYFISQVFLPTVEHHQGCSQACIHVWGLANKQHRLRIHRADSWQPPALKFTKRFLFGGFEFVAFSKTAAWLLLSVFVHSVFRKDTFWVICYVQLLICISDFSLVLRTEWLSVAEILKTEIWSCGHMADTVLLRDMYRVNTNNKRHRILCSALKLIQMLMRVKT